MTRDCPGGGGPAVAGAGLTKRVRLSGLLPLAFFLAHSAYYLKEGGLANMLWMCNISNLLLGAGLLLARAAWIRVAVIWLIPGLALWLWYVVLRGGWLLTSTFAHVGGLAVGIIALARVRSSRRTWILATAWFLFIQQVSRMFTPEDWNINVAHRVYAGWEGVFSAYWQYWIATTLVTAAGLWSLGLILLRAFPALAGRGR